ncbi:MAG TPA: rhodanese-like domain-containing protein [Gemmatimonadaceae bacterium]|nr:rhodanese-like domain-containing protein [Gemmatimonadaceae bacterium]
MKTCEDLYRESRARVRQITAKEALEMHASGRATFVDVRDLNEVNLGMIPGAIHLDRGRIESKVEKAIPRETPVVLYCAAGNRSALAAETLREMGYTDVVSLDSGFRGWVEAGGDIQD